MRAIRLILLIYAMFCILLLCIVKVQSTRSNAVREILALGTENCTQPCWNNITLDRTTFDQAIQIMLRNSEIKAWGIGLFDMSYANTQLRVVLTDASIAVPDINNIKSVNVSTIEFQVDVVLGEIMFKDPPAYIGYILLGSGYFPVLINADQTMMLIIQRQFKGPSACMPISSLDHTRTVTLTAQLPSIAKYVYVQRWNGFRTCYRWQN